MIIIKNLQKEYGDNVVFDNACAKINKSDKIALLSQNGKGKTTLLRCIAGLEDYQGAIETQCTVSVMEQEKDFSKIAQTFTQYINSKTQEIREKIRETEEKFTDPELYENAKVYNRIMQEYEALCRRKTESIEENKLKRILQHIGFSLDLLSKRIDTLSGGEQTAIRLAECLARDADLYILDEPTNHLDLQSIRWLEQEIKSSSKTFIVVSHDRSFLDSFATMVVEIENKKLVTYKTNYSGYVKEREHHREIVAQNFDSNSKKYKRLMESAKEKRIWASKNCNRGLKIKADNLERQAKALDLTNIVDDKYEFKVLSGLRTSNRVFEVVSVSKSFVGKDLFRDVSFEIFRKDRIAITGRNGVGKSTFLKILLGEIVPDSGSVNKGMNLKIGLFDQKNKNLPLKQTILEYFLNRHNVHENRVINLARRFGFEFDLRKKKIQALSGGQKSKLELMHIFLGGFNVLVLDEPTNHLDLELRESLEKALLEFEGAIIFVSHDRYFTKKMANKILRIENLRVEVVEC